MIDSLVIAGVVFLCALGGAVLGMLLRAALPEQHLSGESRDVIKLTMGLVASMAALVLGLLVASATSEFNTQKGGFQQLAANILLLDRTLSRYGPEADKSRELVRRTVASFLERNWPARGPKSSGLQSAELTSDASAAYEAIRALSSTDPGQQAIQSQALQTFSDLSKTRFLLVQQDDPSIPRPFLLVLGFWMTVLFVSFGLFAPRNPTVFAALLVCAISVAGAIFLIVDLDEPFDGLIQISSTPLRNILSQLKEAP